MRRYQNSDIISTLFFWPKNDIKFEFSTWPLTFQHQNSCIYNHCNTFTYRVNFITTHCKICAHHEASTFMSLPVVDNITFNILLNNTSFCHFFNKKWCKNNVKMTSKKRHCNDVDKMMLKWFQENDVGSMWNWGWSIFRPIIDQSSISKRYCVPAGHVHTLGNCCILWSYHELSSLYRGISYRFICIHCLTSIYWTGNNFALSSLPQHKFIWNVQ